MISEEMEALTCLSHLRDAQHRKESKDRLIYNQENLGAIFTKCYLLVLEVCVLLFLLGLLLHWKGENCKSESTFFFLINPKLIHILP